MHTKQCPPRSVQVIVWSWRQVLIDCGVHVGVAVGVVVGVGGDGVGVGVGSQTHSPQKQ